MCSGGFPPFLAVPPRGGHDLVLALVADQDPTTEPPLHLGSGVQGIGKGIRLKVSSSKPLSCSLIP